MHPLMKAVRFHGPGHLRCEEIERPGEPSGTEVKVKVEAAGVCGTDLHVYRTGSYVSVVPVTMGHEFAGRVLSAGPDVGGIAPADHVVGDSRVSCGTCEFCLRNLPNLCERIGFVGEVREGAYAEEILIDESSLVKIDPSVPFHTAALAEPLAVALHALAQAGIRTDGERGESLSVKTEGPILFGPGTRVLVLGAGPVGALIVAALRLNGFTDVTFADTSSYRRSLMEKVYPGSAADPALLAKAGTPGFDLVFETTGSPAVAGEILPKTVRKRGTVVMVGIFGGTTAFDLTALVENEWNVRGCAAFSSELGEAVRLLEAHHRKFSHVVSHRLPLSDFQRAFDLLLDPRKKAMKIVFVPG